MKNSIIGKWYKSTRPVCSHIAGDIAGGTEVIFGKTMDCEEVECIGKGDDCFKFVIKPP